MNGWLRSGIIGFGIFRLIVNDPSGAAALLKKSGFTVGMNEVVAVAVPDRPGGLAAILGRLQGKNINVEYMYAFVQKCEGNAVLIFRFDDTDKAIDALRQGNITVLSGEEMKKL